MRRLLMAVTVILAVLVATTIQSSAQDGGVINGCINKAGYLRIATPCTKGETPISWNQMGPQGPTGPTGPTGPAGLTGKTTVLTFHGGNDMPHSSPSEWMQYTYIIPPDLHFTKDFDNSTLYVTWNDTLMGYSTSTNFGVCMWDLRIDTFGDPTSFLNWSIYTNSFQSIPISFTATYRGLASGDHAVQLWLQTVNAACLNNAGGWPRTITILEVPNQVGPPGGIDKSKVYDNVCLDQETCACAEGEILLSGGATCNASGGDFGVLEQSTPLSYDMDNVYFAVCYDISEARNVVPQSITVRCLKP